ncbi:hypothetical protein [Endozoicomonas sp.]|uniref:hypothetical protein n=1 Tax=Endozoicomonas sp. TaxID=1892382 RepID=UPI002883B434|nr:hypothetical protein [Endozoicomonas sp.]
MKLTTIIAAHIAALPVDTRLSNAYLKEYLHDTPRVIRTIARCQAESAGFIEHRGYRTKGESPTYHVTGTWTGNSHDYEMLDAIETDKSLSDYEMSLIVPESYKAIPANGEGFEIGLYKLSEKDNLTAIKDRLSRSMPVVQAKTKGSVDWDNNVGTGLYLMTANGVTRSDSVLIRKPSSGGHASLKAMIAATRSLKKPCIVFWETTWSVMNTKGKNSWECVQLIKEIQKGKHIVFWQKTILTKEEFADLFETEKSTA